MKHLFTLHPRHVARRLALLVTLLLPLIGWGQTTIAGYDFEPTPATPTATVTLAGGATYSGSSASTDRPATSTFYSQGTQAYGISSTNTTVATGSVTSSANINASAYSNISVSFRLAAFSINSTGNGVDGPDLVVLAISTDGGVTYSNEVQVAGNTNAYWHYSTGTATASRAYSGNNTPTAFAPAAGGNRTTDGYSTVAVTGIASTANLRFRITMSDNAVNERWMVDDILVKGTLTPIVAPSVTTAAVTSITATTATGNGTVTADGGAAVTGRGIVYGIATAPTIATGTQVMAGTGTGAFTASLTGLTNGTTYFVRAYAINSVGTTYGNEVTFVAGAAPAPVLTASPTALSGFGYQQSSGGPSASQSFTIAGDNLTGAPGNLSVAGSTNYEVSADNTTFGASASVPYATATLAATPVYVRLKAGLTAGPYNGETITVSGGGAATNATVTASGTVVVPVVTVAGALVAFNTLAGAPSAAQTLTVSGVNLTNDILLTAPTGYELSTNGGTTYAATGTLTASGGTVAATPVRLRLTGLTATGSLGTVLQIRSTNAANQDQATSGTVVAEPTAPAPTVVAGTPTASSVVLTLGAGTGTNLLVVVRQSGTAAVAPTDATTYSMSASTYGSTTISGSTGPGNFVLFTGPNATSTTVYGLAGGTSYVADVYSYNVGTANGFENYNPSGSSSAFFTTLPASALLLEEDFDYAPGTVLANNNTTPSTTTGWKASSGNGTNNIATAPGNLTQPQYPQGAMASTTNPVTSSQVSITTSGQDIAKPFAPAASLGNLYYTALVNVSAAQANGDYFLHLVDNVSTSNFRGRVFVRSTAGGINFGVSVAGTAVYSTTVYQLATPYLLVVKYATSGTTVTNDDIISLFVFDNTATPAIEPAAPAATSGPESGAGTTAIQLNAVALRQGSATNAPTLTLDGLRVASDYGTAVGRPSYTSAGARIGAGNYYDLTLSNADQLTPVGAVSVENALNLASGLINTTSTNTLRLYSGVVVAGGSSTSFVNGPLQRETAAAPFTTVFPIGKGVYYRPLTLSATAQVAASTYTADQFEGNPSRTLATGNGLGTAPLVRVSTKRFYTVTSSNVTPGNFTGTITVSFGDQDYVNTPSDPDFVVAKRDATGPNANEWTNLGRSANTGTDSGPGGPSVAGTLTSAPFSDFSDFVLGAQNDLTNVNFFQAINPLPVELTAFSAQRQADKAVALKWITASEKNSARFEAQRSLDGREFVTVASATAQGSSTHATVYAALDKTAPAGRLYYRLRQVDLDGHISYSPVVLVTGSGELAKVQLYPNPARRSLSFIAEGAMPYRVLNQLGQPLLRGTTETGTTTIGVEALPASLYFLELQTATGRQVQKFEKE